MSPKSKNADPPAADAAPAVMVCVLRSTGADRKSKNGFVWPTFGPVECPDWKPTTECGHGLHGLLWGIGDWSLCRTTDPNAVWQVVEVDAAALVDLDGKVKFPRGEVIYSGTLAGALALTSKRHFEVLKEKAVKDGAATTGDGAPAATTGDYAPAATTGDYAPAATTGSRAPAATTGDRAPAATTGDYAPAATTGSRAPAATTGDYAPAATTGDYAPAATTGSRAPAATTGPRAPAATTGCGAPAATTGSRAPAATTGYGAPAATTGDYAPAATTGSRAPAATTGYGAPAATTGYRAPAATTGYGAPAATTGDYAPAATTGDYAPAATTGSRAPAACIGLGGRAKAGPTSSIILTYRDTADRIRHTVGYVGEDGIEPHVWYEVTVDGKLARAADQSAPQ
ncbi:MAG: hypothetical protein U0804_28545 [Gemmataceae bacterium]